jgi:hypothetical protein
VSDSFTPAQLASLFADIDRQLANVPGDESALQTLSFIAVDRVPGAMAAGVTLGHQDVGFATVAATGELAEHTDAIQYALKSDLRTDRRWRRFGTWAYTATGVVSMLSRRLFLGRGHDAIASLNLYSTRPHAFGPGSETVAVVLATHSALTLARIEARIGIEASEDQFHNLQTALQLNRRIGTAVGVIMATTAVTADQAFALLQMHSQASSRSVAELADQITATGHLPDLPAPR